MKVQLNLQYEKMPSDVAKPEDLTQVLIGEAVSRRYPNGMPRQESRLYGNLLNILYKQPTDMDLDMHTVRLIADCLDKAELPAHMSSWKWTLLDYLESLLKEK